MSRASRSRSRLFPTEGSHVFAGDTKNLTYETGHFTGSKVIGGSFVAPSEQEGKFRMELGNPSATLLGVTFVGDATGSHTVGRQFTVTPHASTQVGDLLVLIVAHGISSEGDDMSPGMGWQRCHGGRVDVPNAMFHTAYYRHVVMDDPAGYIVSTMSEQVPDRSASWWVGTFRNAAIMHHDELIMLEDSSLGVTATQVDFDTGILSGVPRGSVAVASFFWGTSTATAYTSTPPSGFTEQLDQNVADGTNTIGINVSTKEITAEGDVTVGSGSISTAAEWASFAFVVEPKGPGFLGWNGEPGSEQFEFNRYGHTRFTNLMGDARVHGRLRYQKPFALINKNSDQAIADVTTEAVTFTGPLFDDTGVFLDAIDGFDFDEVEHRGLWKIHFHVQWEGGAANTRRVAQIVQEGADWSAPLVVAEGAIHTAGTSVITQDVFYYLTVTQNTQITFQVLQNSGGALDVFGNDRQAETYIAAEWMRDLD